MPEGAPIITIIIIVITITVTVTITNYDYYYLLLLSCHICSVIRIIIISEIAPVGLPVARPALHRKVLITIILMVILVLMIIIIIPVR